jgi:hypothetical protein
VSTKTLKIFNVPFVPRNLNATQAFDSISNLFKKALKIFNTAKKFGLNSQLEQHVKTLHENAKDFGCSICAKKFGSYSRLHHHFYAIMLGELKLTTEHQFHSMDILHK